MKALYTIFRGFSLLMVSFLTALLIISLPMLNPVAKDEKKAETKSPGDIVVHVVWPEGNFDVDMWLDGPGEPVPVGYSNKAGILWNLLRDDLGNLPDATPLNYENAYTRGIVPGDYTVNVQCFGCEMATFPFTADVSVSVRKPDSNGTKGGLENIATSKVLFRKAGEEKTAVRFVVKDDKSIDMDSINNIYTKLVGNKPPSASFSIPYYYDQRTP